MPTILTFPERQDETLDLVEVACRGEPELWVLKTGLADLRLGAFLSQV